MARELIIIDGRCYDIEPLGWNPKICNPQLKEMIKGKDLRNKYLYLKKNDTSRVAYTSEQLEQKYRMGWLDERLRKIVENEYICYSVEADWNEEFPDDSEIKWEKQ